MHADAQVDTRNRLWYLKKKEDHVSIGLTKDFLAEVQDECWHLIPNYNAEQIKEGTPLFSVETNDGLKSVLSPFTGTILEFSYKAQNDPHKLTVEDEIITFSIGGKRGKKKVNSFPPPPQDPPAGRPDQPRNALTRNGFTIVEGLTGFQRERQYERLVGLRRDWDQAAAGMGAPWVALRFTTGEAINAFDQDGALLLIRNRTIAIE